MSKINCGFVLVIRILLRTRARSTSVVIKTWFEGERYGDFCVGKSSYYNSRCVRENQNKSFMSYRKMLDYSMSEIESILGKDIFYNIDHNEIDYDYIM